MVTTSDNEIRSLVLETLAIVRCVSVKDLEKEIAGSGGDIEVDSKQGQAVAVMVQERLDIDGLIRVEDQKRSTLTSVDSLTQLIERRRAECAAKEGN